MTLAFKKLSPDAVMPARATSRSAGLDIRAFINETNADELNKNACIAYKDSESGEWVLEIHPHETVLVPTGLAVKPLDINSANDDIVMLLFARSGLATKHGINLANGVGVIDSDYRGEIRVALHNNSFNKYVVKNGDRIAQLVVTPIYIPAAIDIDTIDTSDIFNETERGTGGFGSTGKS